MPLNIDFDNLSPVFRFMAGDVTVELDDVNGNPITGEAFRDRILTAQKYEVVMAQDVDIICEFTTNSLLQGDSIVLDIPTIVALCP